MPTIKRVFQFVSANGGRWSETWWRDATGISSELALSPGLINARLNVLAALNYWVGDYVSQQGNPRIAAPNTFRFQGKDGGTGFVAPPIGPACISDAAVINCVGSAGSSKRP